MIPKLRVAIVAALALVMVVPTVAHASVPSAPAWTDSVTGTVNAVAKVGDRLVIGGNFTSVGGLPRRNAAAILPNGFVDPNFDPSPDGTIQAVAGSSDGSTVFLGGTFTAVGGAARSNLAAVDLGGVARDGWTAVTNGTVFALATSGTRLYVGGQFTEIGTVSRRRLAAVETTTGAVVLGFNPWPDWTVKGVAVSPDGTKVYAAGGFKTIGGAPRLGGAEVLASSGRATEFVPDKGGVGIAVGLTPDGSRFYFSTTDNRMYAYDPAVSNIPVYVIQTSGDTQAIAASATEVYFGGHFSQVNTFKVKRSLIASVRVADGGITDWNPGANGYMGVWALAVTSDSLLVGGDFTRIGGKARKGVARFMGTP